MNDVTVSIRSLGEGGEPLLKKSRIQRIYSVFRNLQKHVSKGLFRPGRGKVESLNCRMKKWKGFGRVVFGVSPQ